MNRYGENTRAGTTSSPVDGSDTSAPSSGVARSAGTAAATGLTMPAALTALLLLGACNEAVYDDLRSPPPTTNPGGQSCSQACASDEICVDGRCVDQVSTLPGSYVSGRDAATRAARSVAQVVCQRLHGDCKETCSDPWVFCGATISACMDEYVKNWTEDIEDPVADAALASMCAQQIRGRSCQDLDPDSAACDNAVIQGCPNDQDGNQTPYSWPSAVELGALPQRISPYLCGGVSEWYAVDLQAGETITVALEQAVPETVWVNLHKPPATAGENTEELTSTTVTSGSPSGETQPIIDAGRYYLEIEQWTVTGEAPLSIGTNLRPAPSARDAAKRVTRALYEAVCTRLHGDCAASCSSDYLACGTSVAECADRLVEAAIDSRPDAVNAGAVAACAAALSTAACTDMASVPSCMTFVNSYCEDDNHSFARPKNASMAAPIQNGAAIPLRKCDRDEWWYTINLEAGEHIEVDWPMATYLRAEIYGDPDGRTLDTDSERDGTGVVLDPVMTAGTYYLTLRAESQGTATVRVTR